MLFSGHRAGQLSALGKCTDDSKVFPWGTRTFWVVGHTGKLGNWMRGTQVILTDEPGRTQQNRG